MNTIDGISLGSHYQPTYQECLKCEYKDKCKSGELCVNHRVAKERRTAAKQSKTPTGYRVVNEEMGLRAAVRKFDPEKTIVFVCYSSPTLEDVVYEQKADALALCKRLNKEKEKYGGGKWTTKEVYHGISNSH